MRNELAFRQLENMRMLGLNWDSYGAKPIDLANIVLARNVLDRMWGNWAAVPCSDGSVQLEQHEGGFDIEIRISVAAAETKLTHDPCNCLQCEIQGK